jgi:predicted nucleotidyltransferase
VGGELDRAREYAQEIVLCHPALKGVREKVGLVLSGSRAVGYHVPSSDYDFLALCDGDTYADIARLAGVDYEATRIDLTAVIDQSRAMEKEQIRQRFGIEVDIAVYESKRVERALGDYRDVVLWIWTNAKVLFDPTSHIETLQESVVEYPMDVLERKLKAHYLMDFHLSVHGVTYRYESQNVFSVVYALAAKIAEFCRLCCLLDGKPFPYEKWLLRACQETATGAKLSPFLVRALDNVTRLGNDLVESSELVREAMYALDTEACDILDEALVSWGIDKEWVENPYSCLGDVLLEQL